MDWDFKTTPQGKLGGRELSLPRGKMLGGCSAISKLLTTSLTPSSENLLSSRNCAELPDAQIYQHCAPSDFDDASPASSPQAHILILDVELTASVGETRSQWMGLARLEALLPQVGEIYA